MSHLIKFSVIIATLRSIRSVRFLLIGCFVLSDPFRGGGGLFVWTIMLCICHTTTTQYGFACISFVRLGYINQVHDRQTAWPHGYSDALPYHKLNQGFATFRLPHRKKIKHQLKNKKAPILPKIESSFLIKCGTFGKIIYRNIIYYLNLTLTTICKFSAALTVIPNQICADEQRLLPFSLLNTR